MTVSAVEFKRFVLAKESAFKTPGSYAAPRGLKKDATVNASYSTIAREDALNSSGDRYAPERGMQSMDFSVGFIVNSNTFTDFTDVFTAALGALATDTTLTFTATSTNVGCTFSGGAASGIFQVTGSDSKKYLVLAAVQVATTSINYWPSIPSGITTTAIVNLSGTPTGGVFKYSLTPLSATTFAAEFDWSATPSSTTQDNILALGCGITSLQLVWARDKLLELKVGFVAASYTEGGGASTNNVNPTVPTNSFQGWAGDVFLSSGTPVWGTDQIRAKALTIELAPKLITETGMIGLDGGATASSVVAGSDTTGYTRNPIGEDQVTIRVPFLQAYVTGFKAGTAYGLFGVFYAGVAGGAAASAHRVAVGIRRMVQSAYPKVVEDGGGRYHDLTFAIERDLTANSGCERLLVAFTTA